MPSNLSSATPYATLEAQMMKFTDRYVRNLKPQENRYEVWDGSGLGVRVSPKGRKTWVYVYHFHGRSRRLTLGKFPGVSVRKAHAAHGEALSKLEEGIDPGLVAVKARKTFRDSPTVREIVDFYIDKWARPRKRSWKEDLRILEKDVVPRWGRMKIADVTRRDVMDLLDTIVARGAPIGANRTFRVLQRMFNFAIERDLIQNTPCLRIRPPAPEHRRERVLNEHELTIFLRRLSNAKLSEMTKLALQFQLHTAQRRGEVARAEWSNIDLTEKVWTIPAPKSKNNSSHRVPLSRSAVAILENASQLSHGSRWVFPAQRGNNHITERSITRGLSRNLEYFDIEHFTPHDLRRTAATHMARSGLNRLVLSKILNHVDSSITSIYDLHSYDSEKRAALADWSEYLDSLCQNNAS